MSTPLTLARLIVDPWDGPDEGGALPLLIDRTNLFTPGHWEAAMIPDRIDRHYDRHAWEAAGTEPPRVWTEDDALRFWRGMLLGGSLGVLCWLAIVGLVTWVLR